MSTHFTPTTVTPSSGPVSTTVTITAPSATAALPTGPAPLLPPSVLVLSLGGLWWKRRRRWLSLCVLVVFAAGLSLLNGCGGGSSSGAPANTTPTGYLRGRRDSHRRIGEVHHDSFADHQWTVGEIRGQHTHPQKLLQ
jgi:hypothetical protein